MEINPPLADVSGPRQMRDAVDHLVDVEIKRAAMIIAGHKLSQR